MIIGRQREWDILERLRQSPKSSFVAIYGRRRVGKTFLIREKFNYTFDFYAVGIAKGNINRQLSNFQEALESHSGKKIPKLGDWFEAFKQLQQLIIECKSKKKIVFLDEMPWMDTPKSEFISALEHFWNTWASARKDILFIACGSATSWVIKKIINNTGGLHNRVTHQIHVKPFTLYETEEFLKANHFKWNRYQIIVAYMILGGIPYYLEKLNTDKSIAQNIDMLFFHESAELKNEFNNLINSLFKKTEKYKIVLRALSRSDKAKSRNEIAITAKISNGGGLTEVLEELELCDFITKSYPIGGNVNNMIFQITDPFFLFYFRFMHEKKQLKANYWINLQDSPEYRQWSGVAYEKLCFNHINQISRSLGISGIQTTETSWRDDNKKPTTQIDLIIDRKDQVINICEVKFTEGEYTIDKKYSEILRKKVMAFKEKTNTKKAIFLTLITTYPLKENAYSRELIVNRINMNDLFEKIV